MVAYISYDNKLHINGNKNQMQYPSVPISAAVLFFTVGITWEDAPEDQFAVINKDSKIRCVVKARPAATVDWLKESLILSTGM